MMTPDQREARIIQLAGDGLTLRQIGERVGCHHAWVIRVLKRHNVRRRRCKPVRKAAICQADVNFPGAEYSDHERAYLRLCEGYRKEAGKRFLTALDYLEVARRFLAQKPARQKGA